ncbi:nucleoside-diphosphate kinase [Blattabacterium cuenoti]|uniref:nucleoside-diphosphate kinase n=1 Tax=Blattabacterium cuenoti TaxID=1653831 RepID=UPI00163B8F66|nr:nucleoside-diphosphate kinase [Blattabacterium cuenoti]
MYGKITFSIIKPDAVKNNYVVPILSKIIDEGFHIIGIKMKKISEIEAKKFYVEHEKEIFFNSLVEFMSSGPVVLIVLEKKNAVNDFRMLIGDKNPIKAKNGTIRNLYATSLEKNAIHGSDSNEKAIREYQFYFSHREIFYSKLVDNNLNISK